MPSDFNASILKILELCVYRIKIKKKLLCMLVLLHI